MQVNASLEMYDIADLDDDTYALLAHSVGKGYITGYEDQTFRPNKTLSRAEVATILSRFLAN